MTCSPFPFQFLRDFFFEVLVLTLVMNTGKDYTEISNATDISKNTLKGVERQQVNIRQEIEDGTVSRNRRRIRQAAHPEVVKVISFVLAEPKVKTKSCDA